jgi:hypothetical protein
VNTLPTTPRAKKVIDYSMEEARSLKHDYVGTEHILLGLLREDEGVAAQVLMSFGLQLDKVRGAILAILKQSYGNERSDEYAPQSRIHWVQGRQETAAVPPNACPNCGNSEIARVLWNRVHMSAQDQEDVRAGRAILSYHSKLTRRPAWVCLRCSPVWSAVHRMAMQDREWQLAKENAVASEDFETAIKHRDAQSDLRQQLSDIVERLLRNQ